MGKSIQQAENNAKAKSTAWETFELVRLTALVLITTLVGFYAALTNDTGGLAQNLAKLGMTLLGTGCWLPARPS